MRYTTTTKTHPIMPFVGIAIVFAICFSGYDYFTAKEVRAVNDPLVTSSATSTDASPLSSEQISLLNKIDAIKIDTAIFRDPAFQSLQDLTVTLGQQDAGKTNPFAPLGGAVAPAKTKKK